MAAGAILSGTLARIRSNFFAKSYPSGGFVRYLGGRIMIVAKQDAIAMEEVTDPVEIVRARRQRERFQRNSAWLQGRVAEIYSRYRGKFICVAGQELFVADTPRAAIDLAKTAHPDDDGRLIRHVPRTRLARIYAH